MHPHPLPGASASCSHFSWGLGVGAGGSGAHGGITLGLPWMPGAPGAHTTTLRAVCLPGPLNSVKRRLVARFLPA